MRNHLVPRGMAGRFHCLLSVCFVAVLMVSGAARATVDPIYRAGQAYGVPLYWVPLTPNVHDTLEWRSFCRILQEHECASEPGVAPAAAALAVEGWTLARAKNCSVMAMALMLEQGVQVCVLTQWHASLRKVALISAPGMSTKALRHTMLSDFRWEVVERASLVSAPSGRGYTATLWYLDAGRAEYRADEPVVRSNCQILGSGGLSVRIVEQGYYEDLTVVRTVYDVVVIVRGDEDLAGLTTRIEKAMDARGLDLTYRAPTFVPMVTVPPPMPEAEPEKGQDQP